MQLDAAAIEAALADADVEPVGVSLEVRRVVAMVPALAPCTVDVLPEP